MSAFSYMYMWVHVLLVDAILHCLVASTSSLSIRLRLPARDVVHALRGHVAALRLLDGGCLAVLRPPCVDGQCFSSILLVWFALPSVYLQFKLFVVDAVLR